MRSSTALFVLFSALSVVFAAPIADDAPAIPERPSGGSLGVPTRTNILPSVIVTKTYTGPAVTITATRTDIYTPEPYPTVTREYP